MKEHLLISPPPGYQLIKICQDVNECIKKMDCLYIFKENHHLDKGMGNKMRFHVICVS